MPTISSLFVRVGALVDSSGFATAKTEVTNLKAAFDKGVGGGGIDIAGDVADKLAGRFIAASKSAGLLSAAIGGITFSVQELSRYAQGKETTGGNLGKWFAQYTGMGDDLKKGNGSYAANLDQQALDKINADRVETSKKEAEYAEKTAAFRAKIAAEAERARAAQESLYKDVKTQAEEYGMSPEELAVKHLREAQATATRAGSGIGAADELYQIQATRNRIRDMQAKDEAKKAEETAAREREKQMGRGRSLADSVRTPAEILDDKIADFKNLLSAGAIDKATYLRAGLAAGEDYKKSFGTGGTFEAASPNALLKGSAEANLAADRFSNPVQKQTELIQQQVDKLDQMLLVARQQLAALEGPPAEVGFAP